MKLKKCAALIFLSLLLVHATAQRIEKMAPGIWRVRFGTPEKFLPTEFKNPAQWEAIKKLPDPTNPPFDLSAIDFRSTHGGILAEMKVDSNERFYGFGMQTNSFEQRGMRREIRTNSWVTGDLGFGHAVMPFYISSKGYGVMVNTSRYTSFYMASKGKLDERLRRGEETEKTISLSTVDLYGKKHTVSDEVSILVNGAQGLEIYLFAGPSMKEVIERYNLFSGGGALPPLWGLGFKYRVKASFNDHQVMELARYFREKHIPCDMLGLEPGWQTASYSCSFVWNQKNFPRPDSFIRSMNQTGFKLNLWEHAYTHPSSPIFDSVAKYAGNYTVWLGAVPDFIPEGAKRIFGNYHEEQFVKKGIAAFKLDECDAANFQEASREWSFPDIAQFPSGVDGVAMRQLFGLLYTKTMLELYRKNNQRTLFDARASYLFAAPYAAVLYSDMYNHGDFVRMIINSGFAGVNWSPELRESSNEAVLIRRMQTTVMSAQMVVNGWYLDLPPWLQYNVEKNKKRELLSNHEELEQKARNLIQLRMQLLPYLYTAFARYYFEGLPPFRALVMDYASDPNVWKIDDEYMMGESMLCAPFLDSSFSRRIYFPEGNWYDFNNNQKYEGGKWYTVTLSLDQIPMFIKEHTILPLADPVEYISPETVLSVHSRIYGQPSGTVRLFEDNSWNFDYSKGKYNWIELGWKENKGTSLRKGNFPGRLFDIKSWETIKQ